MNERKKLKKQLVNKYIFKMYLSVNEVKKILSENPKDKHDTLFASLTVGCVKINAVLFPTPDKCSSALTSSLRILPIVRNGFAMTL